MFLNNQYNHVLSCQVVICENKLLVQLVTQSHKCFSLGNHSALVCSSSVHFFFFFIPGPRTPGPGYIGQSMFFAVFSSSLVFLQWTKFPCVHFESGTLTKLFYPCTLLLIYDSFLRHSALMKMKFYVPLWFELR